MIRISKNEISFSKYLLCGLILFVFIWHFYSQKIIHAFTYRTTTGSVDYITYRTYGSRNRTAYYPVVKYTVNGEEFRCIGSSYERDELHPHDPAAVLYDPADPANGNVYTFLGYWAPYLTFTISFVLVVTLVFGIDVIPNRIYLKKPAAAAAPPLVSGLD